MSPKQDILYHSLLRVNLTLRTITKAYNITRNELIILMALQHAQRVYEADCVRSMVLWESTIRAQGIQNHSYYDGLKHLSELSLIERTERLYSPERSNKTYRWLELSLTGTGLLLLKDYNSVEANIVMQARKLTVRPPGKTKKADLNKRTGKPKKKSGRPESPFAYLRERKRVPKVKAAKPVNVLKADNTIDLPSDVPTVDLSNPLE